MIRLDLTRTEADHLQQALAAQVVQSTAEEVVVVQALLAKLDVACQQAAVQLPCPVCQQPFTQLNSGRLARYCSNACKQKAYRQRRVERTRQWRPDWLYQAHNT